MVRYSVSRGRPGSHSRSYRVIENYLVIRLIDCDPLTRSYITRVRNPLPAPPLQAVSSPLSCAVQQFLSLFSRGSLASARARARGLSERRLSGVRSANKSNTPRFVQRESSSFTIHEFIMGTTEDTAGPLLLIYRYASPATNGPRLP